MTHAAHATHTAHAPLHPHAASPLLYRMHHTPSPYTHGPIRYGSKVMIPCCGFGFGDCVIYELLKDLGKLPVLPRLVDFVVAAYDDSMFGPACQVAAELRKGGASVDMLQEPKKKVARAFDYADRAGAR